MAGQGGPNMDQFEAFFQRADLDRDGRISGAEAVGFFQGSNLPKPVLAQIWQYSDPRGTGFLGRAEFYNALKLVTVAQSRRELTPDIVKAALYGPASAKIPAPQINLAAIQAPQSSVPAPVAQMGRGVPPQQTNLAATTPQMGQIAPSASQNVGFRGQVPPNANPGFGGQTPPNANLGFGGQAPPTANLGFGGQAHTASTMNQNYYSSQGNPSMRPPGPLSTGSALRPQHGAPTSDFSTRGTVASSAPAASNWAGGQIGGVSTQSSNQAITTPTSSAGSKSLESFLSTSLPASTGSTASVGSGPGNGYTPNSVFGGNNFSAAPSLQSASSAALSSAIVPVSSGPPTSSTPDLFSSLQSGFTRQPAGNQQLSQPPSTANQHVSAQNTALIASSGPSVGQVNSTSNQAQLPWPKMTAAGIQKYTKVFMEVDSDRDGKITGEQARSLFMSWRLPREVLKQVWDLSDQDNDSMLSLKEFCVALYLMERFREGRPLPPTLPGNILLDETLLSLTSQPGASYGNAAWGHTAGFRPQQGMPGVRPMGPAAGLRPPVPGRFPQADGAARADQQKDRTSSVASSHANQLSNGEQISLDTNSQGSTETEKKVDEKIFLDSKEKLEFYRTKMQDLVLYKSRCDNRLNEITERALADKREAELLGKKYEEKYKQVAETASKLTIEEAAFREIQERKIELQQAITKMEQGGSADGILQVRADRIQSELEELLRALTERCKKHGIDIKSAAIIELPTGWQPGIPEISSVWDEDWDKFDDEGLSFGMSAPPQTKPSSPKDHFAPDLMSYDDEMSETSFSRDERPFEVESAYGHSEDESGKSPGSPAGQSAFESPSQEYASDHFRKSPEADTDSQRNFDEPGWGTFDNNDDDIDSVWGFNNSKGSDHDKYGEKSFFDSSEFGDSPRRTDSPHADPFQKKSLFFEDSVPSTPLSRAGGSPPRYSFDNMSRFDSFSTRDDTFTASKNFSRFDSMSSTTTGFERGQGHARFDSISSTSGFDHKQGYSFDDNDPFGSSGPFKVTSDGQTPKKGSEPWSSF